MKLKKNVLLIFEPGRNFAPAIPVDKYVKKIEKEILTLTDVAKLIIFDQLNAPPKMVHRSTAYEIYEGIN